MRTRHTRIMALGFAICGVAAALGFAPTPAPAEPVTTATLNIVSQQIAAQESRLQSIENRISWLWVIAGGGSVSGGGLAGWLSTRRPRHAARSHGGTHVD